MNKENHIEVSDGDTVIIAYEKCPLSEKDLHKDQCFNGTVCCKIQGQLQTSWMCPRFYKVVYGEKGFQVDCR